MIFLCRYYILPSKLLSHDLNTPDLVINTRIEKVKFLSFVVDIPFHYCYKHPMILDLGISPTSQHSTVEEHLL